MPEADRHVRGDRFPRSTPEPEPSSCHLHAGHRLSSKQVSPRLLPEVTTLLGFDAVATLTTRHQWFTRVHLLGAYLTHSSCALSATLTTPALNRRSVRWFEASPCRATPEGLPPSLAQPASVGPIFYIRPSFSLRGAQSSANLTTTTSPSGTSTPPLMDPLVEYVMKVDVGEQRRRRCPLRCSFCWIRHVPSSMTSRAHSSQAYGLSLPWAAYPAISRIDEHGTSRFSRMEIPRMHGFFDHAGPTTSSPSAASGVAFRFYCRRRPRGRQRTARGRRGSLLLRRRALSAGRGTRRPAIEPRNDQFGAPTLFSTVGSRCHRPADCGLEAGGLWYGGTASQDAHRVLQGGEPPSYLSQRSVRLPGIQVSCSERYWEEVAKPLTASSRP